MTLLWSLLWLQGKLHVIWQTASSVVTQWLSCIVEAGFEKQSSGLSLLSYNTAGLVMDSLKTDDQNW